MLQHLLPYSEKLMRQLFHYSMLKDNSHSHTFEIYCGPIHCVAINQVQIMCEAQAVFHKTNLGFWPLMKLTSHKY